MESSCLRFWSTHIFEVIVMKLKNHVRAVKQALVKDIEGLTLRKAPMTDKVMAMLGLTVEAGTILVLMFPAGVPLALGAAALPLLINVAAAWFHSTYYEIPEAYAELLSRYEEYLLADSLSAQEALEIVRLHAAVTYLTTAHGHPSIRSVGQAKGRAQMVFAQERMADLEKHGIQALTQCQNAHQAKVKALAERCPEPEVDIRGMTAAAEAQAQEDWKQAWIEAETAKLEDEYQVELEHIQQTYGWMIADWRHKEAQGVQEYRDFDPTNGSAAVA